MNLKPVVLCGPSGVGKSTFIKKLLSDYPDKFELSISHTTRKPRNGETNGKDMEKSIANGEFIEHAVFSGNMYGTSKKAILDIQKKGKICVLDIDVQGVKQLKQLNDPNFQPIYIFIAPPSMDTLKERLVCRKTDSSDAIKRRLETAYNEIEYAKTKGNFDYIITNDDFDRAYSQFLSIIKPIL